MHKLLLIIKREFLTKVKSKAYLVLIFLSPILMLAMFMAIFYFASKEESLSTDKAKILLIASKTTQNNFIEKFPKYEFQQSDQISYDQSKQLFKEGLYDVVIYSNFITKNHEVYGDKNLPLVAFKDCLRTLIKDHILNTNNINNTVIKELKDNIVLVSNISNNNTITKWVKGTIAIGSGYLIMMFVIIYGNSVMRSIIEEKNSRVIEILICTVKPFQLMLGKIIGNALAGLLQFLIWGVLLIMGLVIIENNFYTNVDDTEAVSQIFNAIWQINYFEIFICFILFFLSGYLLYSGFYTTVGAAVNSETDTQQFVHPILLPLMFAVYIGIATVINGNPNGETAILFSLIPFTSPIIMLMRIPFGVPLWQIILSLALLLVSFITTVYIASKIYRIGILTYGNKPTIKQLMKWILQKQ